MKLRASEKIRIKEYVNGLIRGASLYTDSPVDSLGEDYWFYWSDDLDINVCLDDYGDWQCAAHPILDDGRTDGTDWLTIKLNEETNHEM